LKFMFISTISSDNNDHTAYPEAFTMIKKSN